MIFRHLPVCKISRHPRQSPSKQLFPQVLRCLLIIRHRQTTRPVWCLLL